MGQKISNLSEGVQLGEQASAEEDCTPCAKQNKAKRGSHERIFDSLTLVPPIRCDIFLLIIIELTCELN